MKSVSPFLNRLSLVAESFTIFLSIPSISGFSPKYFSFFTSLTTCSGLYSERMKGPEAIDSCGEDISFNPTDCFTIRQHK